MPAGFYEPKPANDAPKRLFLYGPPKTVKTPLALALGAYLRSINPKSKTLYIAADRASEDLPSIPDRNWLAANGGFITVWKPGSMLEEGYNPYQDAFQIAMTDWKKNDPDIELIVYDTFTTDIERILQYCADSEFFANQKGESKHVTFGDPTLRKGHPGRLNIPVMGDYMGTGAIAKRLTDLMGAQNCHVILIAHEESFEDAKGISRIGPAFVGKALTGKLPGYLTGILYTEKTPSTDKTTGKLVPALHVCSDPGDDAHIAGVRHGTVQGRPVNPIGRVKVGDDLTSYWKLFFTTLFPAS